MQFLTQKVFLYCFFRLFGQSYDIFNLNFFIDITSKVTVVVLFMKICSINIATMLD